MLAYYHGCYCTAAEQVLAGTQQRVLQESGNSDELQLELTPQHQSTTHTGDVFVRLLTSFSSTSVAARILTVARIRLSEGSECSIVLLLLCLI